MAAALDIFAVDVVQFRSFIERRALDALWGYAEMGGSARDNLVLRDDAYELGDYVANAEGKVFHIANGVDREISRVEAEQLPYLRQSVREILVRGSGFQINFLLRSLSEPSTKTPWVYRVTTGCGRWWIGSLLDFIRTAHGVTSADYRRSVTLLHRMSLGASGHAMKPPPHDLRDVSFPVLPGDDSDQWMANMTHEETEFVLGLVEYLFSESRPKFKRLSPPYEDMAGNTDEKADAWVHEVLASLLSIRHLNLKEVNVVSFQGS